MKTFTAEELKIILEKHSKFLLDEGGERADLKRAYLFRANLTDTNLSRANLTGADLRGVDLTRANLKGTILTGANLTRANLTDAILTGADLTRANLKGTILTGANLEGANLEDANLSEISKDFFKVLDSAKLEVKGIYKAILEGKVDGSSYQGDCACLVGTIANIKGIHYSNIEGLRPDSERPSERWFLAIKKGNTPDNSQISKITLEWIEEYMKKEGIEL